MNDLKMCKWFFKHKWGKWIDIEERNTAFGNHPVLIQERRCAVCNIAQRRIATCT